MANISAVFLVLYFLVLLVLWLLCVFRPSMCTEQIKMIGLGASVLGALLMLLQMSAREKKKSGGFLMVALLLLLVGQAILWGLCLSRCTSGAADTIKWSGVGTAVLALGVGATAYMRSRRVK